MLYGLLPGTLEVCSEPSVPIPMPVLPLPVRTQRCRDACRQLPRLLEASNFWAFMRSCRPLWITQTLSAVCGGVSGSFPDCLQFACNTASSSPSRCPSSSLPANPWEGASLPSPSVRKLRSLRALGPDWQLALCIWTVQGWGWCWGGWQFREVGAHRLWSEPHVDFLVTSESSLRSTRHLLSSCFFEIRNDKQSQNQSHMSPNACGSALVMFFQLSLVLNAAVNTRVHTHTHTQDNF